MSDEFDIMKPISADLDIGGSMFDKPADKAPSTSAPQAKPYTPPSDSGVYHAQYGYLTEVEAAVLDESNVDFRDDNDKISASESVMTAAGASSDPRSTVITDFDEYSTPSRNIAAAPPPTSSYNGQRMSVKPAQAKKASGFPKAVKIIVTVMGLVFLLQFLFPLVMYFFLKL